MYSPYHPQDVPEGYGGNACTPPRCPPEKEETGGSSGGLSALTSLFAPLSKLNLGGLLSSDLLLIAIALLLFSSKGDDCEEKDEDLWLLLVLLFFMK